VQDYRCLLISSYREYASPMGLKPATLHTHGRIALPR